MPPSATVSISYAPSYSWADAADNPRVSGGANQTHRLVKWLWTAAANHSHQQGENMGRKTRVSVLEQINKLIKKTHFSTGHLMELDYETGKPTMCILGLVEFATTKAEPQPEKPKEPKRSQFKNTKDGEEEYDIAWDRYYDEKQNWEYSLEAWKERNFRDDEEAIVEDNPGLSIELAKTIHELHPTRNNEHDPDPYNGDAETKDNWNFRSWPTEQLARYIVDFNDSTNKATVQEVVRATAKRLRKEQKAREKARAEKETT